MKKQSRSIDGRRAARAWSAPSALRSWLLVATLVLCAAALVTAIAAPAAIAVVPGPGGMLTWSSFDGSLHIDDVFSDTARCPDGDVVAAGRADDNTHITGSALVVKYRPDGSSVWTTKFKPAGVTTAAVFSVAVDAAGDVAVAGGCWNGGYDIMVAKLDGDTGAVLWSSVKAGSADALDGVDDVAVDAAGAVYVCGSLDGWAKAVVVKYAATADPMNPGRGKELWTSTTKGVGAGSADATALAVDGSSNVYVTGYRATTHGVEDCFVRKLHPDGSSAWLRGWDGAAHLGDYTAHLQLASGRLYVCGETKTKSHETDFFLLRYRTSGRLLWARTWDDGLHMADSPTALAVDGHGNALVTGETWPTPSTVKGVLVKWSPTGARLWVRTYKGVSGDGGSDFADLAVTPAGTVFIAGYRSDSSSTIWLALRYSAAGKRVWVFTYGGPPADPQGGQFFSVALCGSNEILAAGAMLQTGHADDALVALVMR